MSGRVIPPEVKAAQALASDPGVSTFVSANAGSGKTHVLVSRVVRLLLSDVRPDSILCITFTKAAAANMSNRVFGTLGEWVKLSDANLAVALQDMGAARTDATALEQARRLFAQALETPGGLKVLTIHALCTRLLQQFPFEANVPARFTVIEERDQDDMLARATLATLLAAARVPAGPLGRALAIAMREAGDMTLHDMVRQAVLCRNESAGWILSAGGLDRAIGELAERLAINATETLEDVHESFLDDALIPASEWAAIADAIDSAPEVRGTDRACAARLRSAAAADRSAQGDAWLAVFETGKGEGLRARLLTNAVLQALPSIAERLDAEKARIAAWRDRRNAVRVLERTRAMLTLAEAVSARYVGDKRERGLLDYDDLIEKTLDLLSSGAAQWVHYKLDRGIDHVLVDEAQDTSPQQWDIIERLVGEFASGAGARDGVTRTLFAVGDEKQSIFSFQGAAPREFAERRARFRMTFTRGGLTWEDRARLNTSFRSGAAILEAVDAVFSTPDMFARIHEDTVAPQHQALSDAAPACVDIWEPEVADATPPPQGWRAPLDFVSETSTPVRLAKRIAAHVGELINGSVTTGSAGDRRAVDAGDVLILVRKRGVLFESIIQALKYARIPVAGADRLQLTAHIAVSDLMVLGDALLMPHDDLALATVLKSPLFGLDDDQLMALASERDGTLRTALCGARGRALGLGDVAERFEKLQARAISASPFAFYAWLLNADGGRARMLRRLDLEAADALDEFLELAAKYDQRGGASLQGFLAWLRAAESEVKRDMESARHEVRVMTVHGAKGLEAPIVFLADTASAATGGQGVKLIKVGRGHDGAADRQAGLVWAGRKSEDPPAIAQARTAMESAERDEHSRLLYVGMTRAADRLIVGCALARGRREIQPDHWYRQIRDGLERSGLARTIIETTHGPVTRFHKEPLDPTAPPALPDITAPMPEPDWLRSDAVSAAPQRQWLRPSDAVESHAPPATATRTDIAAASRRDAAIARGNLVHRLLQSLPDLPPDARAPAALRFLARHAPDRPESERQALCDRVVALIAEPRFAALFGEGSRAEVSIAGSLAHLGRADLMVSGQIDRLVIGPGHILIADYKTGAPPQPGADQPEAYVRQLTLYREILARQFPERAIRAALVWTQNAEIVEVPQDTLTRAIAAIISA